VVGCSDRRFGAVARGCYGAHCQKRCNGGGWGCEARHWRCL